MASMQPSVYQFVLYGALTLAVCTLGGIGAAGGSVGGGGRGSGSYNYGTYGQGTGTGGSSLGSGGLGMRRSVYAPVGLGNPHDAPRYLHSGQVGGSTSQSASSTKGGHHRLSAWGIITIVTFVILIGAGAYWGFICYPFFCKKERNYNMMMNMSSATTATPSTRSTEFEKLDHCCSKSTTSTRSNDTGISNI